MQSKLENNYYNSLKLLIFFNVREYKISKLTFKIIVDNCFTIKK